MAITNGYCTLAELKAALRVADSIDDSLLELAIESASREIDGYCERVFYSTSGTRVYAPTNVYYMNTDDIVSITTLKSSSDGVTYDTTWTTSDYQLEPLNGVAGGLVGHPATRIRAVGDYLLPAWATGTIYNLEASMQVVGVFGWSAIPAAIRQATVILAMRIFKRLDAPLGMITNDMGSMRVGRFDPDVEALVMPFRKVSAG
jgi:hypothetical protein